MQLQVGVKLLIKNKSGAILFLRRSADFSSDPKRILWDIPGGRINPGENLADALKREVEEETGHIIQSTPHLIAAQDILVPAKELHVVRLTYMTTEEVPNVELSEEHAEHKWVHLSDIESDDPTIDQYLNQILEDMRKKSHAK